MSVNIALSLSSTKLEVAAGGSVETTITVRNQGQIVDHFAIKVEGLDPNWWTLSSSSVSLFPGDQDQTRLVIRPPKDAEARAGSYPFRVKAISQANPAEMSSEDAFLILRGFAAWEVDMSPTKVVGKSGTYRITVSNFGNTDATLLFQGKDPEEGLYYNFDRDKLTVPAGGSEQLRLAVRPKKGESQKQYNFQVLARPAEAKVPTKESKTINGQLEYPRRRKFPWWILLVILGLLIVAAVVWWFLTKPQCGMPKPPDEPGPTASDVILNSPKGGETWIVNATKNITWTAKGSGISTVKLDYSTDNGASWLPIAAGEANDGTYAWKVPDASSVDCLVRVTILDANNAPLSEDVSDDVFTLTPNRTVTVTAPNGGEKLIAGGEINITWTTTGLGVATADLQYSTNKGTDWTSIAAGETNDGTYEWKIPDVASQEYLVRIVIRDANNVPLAEDTCDAVFGVSKLLLPPLKPLKPLIPAP